MFIFCLALFIPIHEQDIVFADSYIDERQMVIVFEEGLSSSEIQTTIHHAGGTVSEIYDDISIVKASLNKESYGILLNNSSIKSIEEDLVVRQSSQFEDYGTGLTNTYDAWNSGFSGKDIKIAIIDSGIANHDDLRIAGGVSTVNYTSSYSDDSGHGTHVAGIIGGLNNNYGIKGIAFQSDLYAVKALNQKGEAFISDIIEGINWSIENKMDIINMSIGTQQESSAFQSAIDQAYESGLLLVAAAGNDGTPSGLEDTVDFPARYSSVIGVAAVDRYSNRADFSSTGKSVEISAPGVRVLSTYLGEQYGYLSGTSMAAPFVTGQLALLKEAYPHLSNKELRQVLIDHTTDIGVLGRDSLYGYGLLRASSFMNPIAVRNPIVDISLNSDNIVAHLGEVIQLTATGIYQDGQNKDISDETIWSSSNVTVLTVNQGEIEINGYGNSRITASYEGITKFIDVYVPTPIPDPEPVIESQPKPMPLPEPIKEPLPIQLSKFEVDKLSLVGTIGDFMQVNATATFTSGEVIDVNNETAWTSSDNNVATVAKGLVTFKNYGKTTIKAMYEEQTVVIEVSIQNPLEEPVLFSFKDVPTFYKPSVDYLLKNQITRGLSTTEFGVNTNIIRADAAVWLAKALGLNIENAKASGFNDVPLRAIGAVNALKQAGVVGGKSTTQFGSNDPLTRGEVAIILQRAYQLESLETKSAFTDVSPRYLDAVNALVDNKVTDGLTATKFGVSRNITRGQLAVFMYRLSD